MLPGDNGLRSIPRKIAGSEINTIDAFTAANSVPSVVLDRATHL